mmetsp:Transcript_15638/g.31722  ORF Transcript_15638/g.31722 Transcript_15638/m.31722 type:complete len:211 (+) Transcript_15638:175-807(+)
MPRDEAAQCPPERHEGAGRAHRLVAGGGDDGHAHDADASLLDRPGEVHDGRLQVVNEEEHRGTPRLCVRAVRLVELEQILAHELVDERLSHVAPVRLLVLVEQGDEDDGHAREGHARIQRVEVEHDRHVEREAREAREAREEAELRAEARHARHGHQQAGEVRARVGHAEEGGDDGRDGVKVADEHACLRDDPGDEHGAQGLVCAARPPA